jgi:hypothetical protein
MLRSASIHNAAIPLSSPLLDVSGLK